METLGLSLGGLLLFLSTACAELQVSVVSPHTAALGSDTLLECTFTVDQPSVNVKHLAVVWSLDGKDLLQFGNGLRVFELRASIDEAEIQKGNASLVLSNVTVSDEGTYRCSVIYSPERRQDDITLKLQAPPEIIAPEQRIIKGRENLLRCFVVGFYPVEIDVSWLRDGHALPGSSMSRPQRLANGTFMINSTVPLVPADSDAGRNFSCHVRHASLPGPLEVDVRLLIVEDLQSGGISVTALVVSLLVILVIGAVLAWFLYRRLSRRKLELCQIQGPQIWTVGETVELICVGHHCPKGTEVKWTKIHEGNEEALGALDVPEHQTTEPLLKQEGYTVKTRAALEDSGPSTITSTLRVTPSVEEDEGAIFKCTFHTNSPIDAVEEFKVLKVQGKPQVLDIISCVPYDGKNVLCSLELQKYYPREIQIKWSCGAGELQDVPSEEYGPENADHRTFNIRTECRIPEEDFTDPNFRIRVTWEHTSLEAPGYREMSVTDPGFPGHPVLEDIAVPCLVNGKKASLQCRASGYSPKELKVEWMKLKIGSDEPVPLSDMTIEKDRCPEPLVESGRGYSSVASLTFTPLRYRDQDLKFVCRVSHPSLTWPLEKTMKKLNILNVPRL